MSELDHITKKIEDALSAIGVTGVSPTVELTTAFSHGDVATNVALAVSKTLKKSPIEVAQMLLQHLHPDEIVEKVEIAHPGFLNFTFTPSFLLSGLERIYKEKENFGKSSHMHQKIMVEFADPNPFKQFHIGHLRNITIGESLCRLLESQSALVKRANYQGDVGMHVAKAVFGIKNNESRIKEMETTSIREKTEFLGKCYAFGSKAYEENEQDRKTIQEINRKIYEKDKETMVLWEKGRLWSLEAFEELYKRLDTTYDYYYFESQTAGPGKELVEAHIGDGIFEKDQGAIVFKGEGEGLHTRVFITGEGYPTYEAKDLALAKIKHNDFAYDRSIILTGNEQGGYFKVILKALSYIAADFAKKTFHYTFGFVFLKGGKMSSREGNVVSAQDLLLDIEERLKKQFKEMDKETIEKAAVGSAKYSLLRFARESDITFSFDESISLQGNSGLYLQYTYARTQSVLRRASSLGSTSQKNDKFVHEELALMRLLIRLPYILQSAATSLAPNIVCNFLFELAQAFNLFYQKVPIIESEEVEFRLGLTNAVGQVLKNGLYVLGIEAPSSM